MRLREDRNGVETNFRPWTVCSHFIFVRYITTSIAQWQQTDRREECQDFWLEVIHSSFCDLSKLGQDSNQQIDTPVGEWPRDRHENIAHGDFNSLKKKLWKRVKDEKGVGRSWGEKQGTVQSHRRDNECKWHYYGKRNYCYHERTRSCRGDRKRSRFDFPSVLWAWTVLCHTSKVSDILRCSGYCNLQVRRTTAINL